MPDATPEPTLAELYAKDPYEYSDRDLDMLIETLRKQYREFRAGNDKAGKQPTKALTAVQQKAVDIVGGLDKAKDLLGDL